jgi:hypothetical protein
MTGLSEWQRGIGGIAGGVTGDLAWAMCYNGLAVSYANIVMKRDEAAG